MKINNIFPAKHYTLLKGSSVGCTLCPHFCVLKDSERGKCLTRINQNGKLYSLVYGRPCSVNVDPVEKKPLFHFLPGSKSFSIGTAGCNLRCKFCQNWTISQSKPEEVKSFSMAPENVVSEAIRQGCKSIAYTYTEPTVFFEYVYDIAKLAHKKGLKNIIVSNGFINLDPIKELYPLIDSANIDLKGFTEKYYSEVTSSRLKPVLDAIVSMKAQGTFIEITNLLIPGINDNISDIQKMCIWIKDKLGEDTPLHFSRFFSDYKMDNVPSTPLEIMSGAYDLAKKTGLNYVYLGNMPPGPEENTYCPKCKEVLIKRQGYRILVNNILLGRCKNCSYGVPGIWD